MLRLERRTGRARWRQPIPVTPAPISSSAASSPASSQRPAARIRPRCRPLMAGTWRGCSDYAGAAKDPGGWDRPSATGPSARDEDDLSDGCGRPRRRSRRCRCRSSDEPSTLAELCIVACAEAFRTDGEIVATGIGPVPRLGAGLAKTDPFARTDDDRWRGLAGRAAGADWRRAATTTARRRVICRSRASSTARCGPGGGTRWSRRRRSTASARPICPRSAARTQQPKTQMLGARGFPGNSDPPCQFDVHPGPFAARVRRRRSRSLSSPGYNPARRMPGANYSDIDLRLIVTNLCVMDFGGPDHAIRVVSLHPGVHFDEVQEATGFRR